MEPSLGVLTAADPQSCLYATEICGCLFLSNTYIIVAGKLGKTAQLTTILDGEEKQMNSSSKTW